MLQYNMLTISAVRTKMAHDSVIESEHYILNGQETLFLSRLSQPVPRVLGTGKWLINNILPEQNPHFCEILENIA